MDFAGLNFQGLFLMILPFMIAVIFHEFAHGFVAKYWGDTTAEDHGRLTLNPVPHIDPIGTLLFPGIMMLTGTGFLFGWAKPVPINPNRFRKYRPGLFWVSLAGPGMNFILAFLSAAALCFMIRFVSPTFYLFEPLLEMAKVSVVLNWALGIFNLLPLPPLDGSKIVESFLSYSATQKYEQLAQYSFWILLALIFTGALRILMVPIHFMSNLSIAIMAEIFGLGGLIT